MEKAKATNWSYLDGLAYDFPPDKEYTSIEYIWIGGTGLDIRSKTRVYPRHIETLADIEEWNYDGSSTYQATTENSEIKLKPVRMFRDPFRRGGNNLLVMCETFTGSGAPALANFRNICNKVMTDAAEEKPWFGIEQEYTILVTKGTTYRYPLGWPEGGFPEKQGQYYCSVGTRNAFGREVVEMHMKACMYAGLRYAGLNAEVLPSQWEYQIGPSEGIEAGDHMWISRYLLQRCGEIFGLDVSFDPKPFKGWNGSGAHTNYSTLAMRNPGGIEAILNAIERLEGKHREHIFVYGEGNEKRLVGACETSSISKFSYGVGNRAASVRIPFSCDSSKCGYLEDRRPASNCDPYLVTAMLVDSTCLNGKYCRDILESYREFKSRLITH
eukprot:TRINITY_DN1297_c0_g5_i1.p1 TRINITY_DN1297_c0_g5~~TRINITY_DN1297_c0_g5_i1.p1  ORF type:complete len:384 (-),score=66.21 TRINITY_DN1297_c0_g5_i1:50-1201(-)